MITITTNTSQFIAQSHAQNMQDQQEDIMALLRKMQHDVMSRKIAAVLDYTQQFDGVSFTVPDLKVTPKEIQQAYHHVSDDLITALKTAQTNIEQFHRHQLPNSWNHSPKKGVSYGMRYHPIERVCLYVPGGRAPYPSTVLMDAIPAKIAGVQQLLITTPPQKDGSIRPEILVAADLCGVTDIYKVGGAQAVFAVAYGTESIPKVDKIVGPGNIYVNLAKQLVYGTVDIDKPAGPSDVLVVVEDQQYAAFAAAEMLAQLEHDPLSIAITISSSDSVLQAIQTELSNQVSTLSRKDVIQQSLNNSGLLLAKDAKDLVALTNQIAPEHLVLLVDEYEPLLDQITHAGSIFCGPYTPVTLGDYYAGPNHVLPTSGTARFASPLGVMDFLKYSSHLKLLTDMEGFTAHYNAVDQRI